MVEENQCAENLIKNGVFKVYKWFASLNRKPS